MINHSDLNNMSHKPSGFIVITDDGPDCYITKQGKVYVGIFIHGLSNAVHLASQCGKGFYTIKYGSILNDASQVI